MALTKGTGTSVIASTASTVTSSAISALSDYVTEIYIDMIIVGTATGAATVQIQVSPDTGTTYYSPSSLLWTAPLVAGTYDVVLRLPDSTTKYKVTFTQQSGGTSSTVVVQSNDITSI